MNHTTEKASQPMTGQQCGTCEYFDKESMESLDIGYCEDAQDYRSTFETCKRFEPKKGTDNDRDTTEAAECI